MKPSTSSSTRTSFPTAGMGSHGDAAVSPTVISFWRSKLEKIRLLVGGVSFGLMCGSGWFWGIETWMRPEFACRWPDGVWLALAWAGGLGLAMAVTCGLGKTRRWRWFFAVCAGVVLMLGGMRWMGGRSAVNRLFAHEDVRSVSLSASAPPAGSKFVEWMREHGVKLPAWFDRFGRSESTEPPPLDHLIECSRWPTRRGFVERMMVQSEPSRFLAEYWHRYFPAVVGPDVDLRQRRELMEILDRMRTNPALPETSVEIPRQTATLWMGLVFLTDPPEFAGWRETIRDASFDCTDSAFESSGDTRMRVMDTLLAFDPPEKWGALAAPLASQPLTLRYAVRERVRGMISHLDAIAKEVEASEHAGDWDAAFALWLDTGRLLTAYPDAPDAEAVIAWRRTAMFRWLNTEGLGGMGGSVGRSILANLPPEAVVAMSPEEEEVLANVAFESADRAVAPSANDSGDPTAAVEAHRSVEHVRALYPFLSKSHQAELVRRAAPALVNLPLFRRQIRAQFVLCDRCSNFLAQVWPMLPPENRKDFGPNLHTVWENLLVRPYAHLLCLDAWSGSSRLSAEEWLLSALLVAEPSRFPRFKVVKNFVPRDSINLTEPLPVPRPEDAAVHALVRRLDAAMAAMRSGGNNRQNELWLALRGFDPDRPLPEWMSQPMFQMLDSLWYAGKDGSDNFSAETLVAMKMCMAGLSRPDRKMREQFAHLVQEGRGPSDRLMLHSDLPDPWADVLASPELAGAAVIKHLDDRSRLQSLLSSVVSGPPPAPVVGAMWNALREETRRSEKSRNLIAFGCLFRLAPLIERREGLAMRQDFLRFFASCPIPLGNWPPERMQRISLGRHSYRGGEGIPWEEDRLSAVLSWASDIKRETYPFPPYGVPETYTGVFSYLAQAYVSYADEGIPGFFWNPYQIDRSTSLAEWKRQPLRLPLDMTPWQRARSLHRKHPGLPWPDRAWYRPGENW
jgi:hypothetical protein